MLSPVDSPMKGAWTVEQYTIWALIRGIIDLRGSYPFYGANYAAHSPFTGLISPFSGLITHPINQFQLLDLY